MYPCVAILSTVLNLSSNSELREICAWVIALGNHCIRFMDYATIQTKASSIAFEPI